jgi:hypothetical protein
MLKNHYDSSITSIKRINIHHTLNLPSEIYTLIQLENSLILIGLGNGSLYIYKKENILEPAYVLKVDKHPIVNILQLKDDTIICTSNFPSIFILKENPQNKVEYEISKKINTKSQGKQINKIISLPNDNLVLIDNVFITLWTNKLELKKEKKINTPIIDIISINKKTLACALPLKKAIIYLENEKLNQEYEFKNIKFIDSIDFNNIFSIINDELLFVGGCLGCIYLINLHHKEFVANIYLANNKEIITSVYNLVNGNLLCGGSFVVDNDNKLVKVDSDLVQYEYRQYQNACTEISRKKGTKAGTPYKGGGFCSLTLVLQVP